MTTADPSETIMSSQSIIGREDNPHELLLAACANCRVRTDATRIELQELGWTVVRDLLIPARDHEGFTICPDCSGREYVWEDLY